MKHDAVFDSLPPFTEVKERYDGRVHHIECRLVECTDHRIAIYYRFDRDWVVDELRLHPEHYTVAWYWRDRPFNVYAFRDANHGALGYYFNVATLLYHDCERLHYRDLIVDVVVYPDGRARILDVDELPSDMAAAERAAIEATANRIHSSAAALVAEIEADTRVLVAGLLGGQPTRSPRGPDTAEPTDEERS